MNSGQIDIGNSLLAQAVMNSTAAKRLAKELKALEDHPVEGASFNVNRRDPTVCHVVLEGPSGTPYEVMRFSELQLS